MKRKTNKKSSESEDHYRSMFQHAPYPYQSLDPNGNIIEVNEAWLKALGYKKKEVIGKAFKNFIIKDHRPFFKTYFPKFKKSGSICNVPFGMVKKNGEVISVEYDGDAKYDKNGKFVQTYCMFRDITDKKKVEEALRESEKRFRNIFDYSGGNLILVDNKRKIVSINNSTKRTLGLNEKDLIGKDILQIHTKEYYKKCTNNIKLALSGKVVPCDCPYLDINNNQIPADTILSRIIIDGKKHVLIDFTDITERKKAEEVLKETELNFRALFESSKDAMMTLAPPSWKFTSGNRSIIKMFNVKNEKEFISLRPWELSPKYQPDGQLSTVKAKKMIMKAMKTGSNFFEWTHKKLHGEDFYATVLLTKVDLGKGNVFLQATVRDITERKETELALEKAERLFSYYMDNMDAYVYIKGLDSHYTFINKKFEEGYGLKRDILKKRKCFDTEFFGKKAAKELRQNDLEVMKNSKASAYEEKIGDVYYYTIKFPLRDENDKVIGICGFSYDITEKRVAEIALEKAKEKAENYLDLAGNIIISLDEKANITLLNKRGYEVLGYKEGELEGVNWIDTFIPLGSRSAVWSVFKDLISGKGELVEEYENPITAKGGIEKFIRWNNSLVKNKKGEIVGTMSSGEDITDAKKFEQTKNEFISFVSHQLKGPISAANFGIEFLLMKTIGPVNTEQEEYLREMYKKNKQMVELINMFLNATKIEMGLIEIQAKPLSVNREISRMINEFIPTINEKYINISLDLDKKVGKIVMDQSLLQIVIRNLVANSVKYSKQNGNIKIKTAKHKDHILLTVKDSGIGIPKLQQRKIFSKMFRADNVGESKVEGSGLGLYITQKIVNGMGGKIWFKSVKDKGTTFFVKIPTKKISNAAMTKSLFK